ncbi:MAG: peptidylprolyl isomerase [Bacteroidales bacterium]|nr:peptidylprolyl isomerase [Bacteroidales bacterium]
MKIEDNKVVHLTYQLKVDGEIADSATAEKPLQFIFGMGYLLPKFEENIAGKEVGDEFEFMLTAEQGYGLVNPSAIVDIPRSAFEIDGEFQEAYVQPGRTIPMMSAQGVIHGTVLSVGAETVKMDFNHPMAGKDLHFTGKVELVRDATEEELKNGLFGERNKSCSGSCGSCEGGCGDGECSKEGCDCK